ncbi:MAG: Mrp/NBP35 family ATP-binding protein [Clostridia bacterium]|jgi:Mrp family chromosome partitioning ATPase|nr:Mrp/NBP35 family ATP-binding protein [Clostridia bacterium]MCI2000506.1 Mrp/NBP35 family ATP-binding protein [Clostridia bacterium]MCI2014961.1 Mrp/NBP35 family ATP-binding protein [Clostridia bacterium]
MSEENRACSDSECSRESCEGCEKNPKSFIEETNKLNSIKKVIGVVSGKGGVGKSFVTAMLAVLMNRKDYKTGILDADITGPSIPKMFGINERATMNKDGILPAKTRNDISIMSINLLLEQADAPVIWRGPLLGGVVKQFWTDVIWGDLDVLFIDMPPGTGDVPLTVFQSIPLDGIVIVTSPQELVSMIVKKAYNMAKQMNIPVLGVVENMSYIKCPDCGKVIKLFGESNLTETAKDLSLNVLGRVPIDPVMAKLADKGEFERFSNDCLKYASEEIEALLNKN